MKFLISSKFIYQIIFIILLIYLMLNMIHLLITILLLILVIKEYKITIHRVKNNYYLVYSIFEYDFTDNSYKMRVKQFKLTNYDDDSDNLYY